MQISIMKTLKVSYCLLILSIFFVSCSKDKDQPHPYANKIVGDWERSDKLDRYSAPEDSTIHHYQGGNLLSKEKYYIHPKTGKLWLQNEWTAAGVPKYNEMYTVEFNSDYSELILQGVTWNKK